MNTIALAFLLLSIGTLVLIFRHAFPHLKGDDQLTFRHWIGFAPADAGPWVKFSMGRAVVLSDNAEC